MNIDRKTEVEVTNRKACTTGYTIEDYNLQGGHLTRSFAPGETKIVTVGELESLLATQGGQRIFDNYLFVKDQEILSYLNHNQEMEPEYFYSDEDIKNLILNGSVDEFEDCLNFAPVGVVERVKQLALQLEMPDHNKRKVLFEKTGYNLDNNLIINKAMADDTAAEAPQEEKKTRKIQKTKKVTTTNTVEANPDYVQPVYEVVG